MGVGGAFSWAARRWRWPNRWGGPVALSRSPAALAGVPEWRVRGRSAVLEDYAELKHVMVSLS